MRKQKNIGRWLTRQEPDSLLMKIVRVLGIALIIILGMLIASGILFNAAVLQFIAP
jgi:hypothetical protein